MSVFVVNILDSGYDIAVDTCVFFPYLQRSSLPPAGSSVYRQESKSTPAKESTGNVNDLYPLTFVQQSSMCEGEALFTP